MFNENLRCLNNSLLYENGCLDISKQYIIKNYYNEIDLIRNIICENYRIFIIHLPIISLFDEVLSVESIEFNKWLNLIKNNKKTYYYYSIVIDNGDLFVRGIFN